MPVLPFQPFDPSATVTIHARNLPHWEQPGSTYFVTFRLADSLPQDKLREWEAERNTWLHQHPLPFTVEQQQEFHERFSDRMEQWLDAGYGQCWLRRPDISAAVEKTLKHFAGERYQLGAFVVMPNHVHVLVTPAGNHHLSDILHSWKSYSANRINRMLGRSGAVWQSEYFDHIVRNERSLENFVAYIQQNPRNAGLQADEFRNNTGN